MSDPTHTPEKRFHGAPVSPGISKGIAWVYHHEELVAPHYVIKAERIEEELRRFEDALLLTRGRSSSSKPGLPAPSGLRMLPFLTRICFWLKIEC